MTELTKKIAKFRRTPEHKEAFENIKNMLSNAPILKYPDYNKTFKLHTDASDGAIGAVLTQEYDGTDHSISYYSKKFEQRRSKL